MSDRDLWARELQECLGAQLLTAFYDWQQVKQLHQHRKNSSSLHEILFLCLCCITNA